MDNKKLRSIMLSCLKAIKKHTFTGLFNVPSLAMASFSVLVATAVAAWVAASAPASAPALSPASAPASAPAFSPLLVAAEMPREAPALAPAVAAIFMIMKDEAVSLTEMLQNQALNCIYKKLTEVSCCQQRNHAVQKDDNTFRGRHVSNVQHPSSVL